jgi:trehalose-6-phosphate synthase
MSRLVVVSNRVAPITEGEPTAGGLAAGVLDALKQQGGIWFGWSGEITDDAAGATTMSSIGVSPTARCGRRCTIRSATRISIGLSTPAIAE